MKISYLKIPDVRSKDTKGKLLEWIKKNRKAVKSQYHKHHKDKYEDLKEEDLQIGELEFGSPHCRTSY